MSDPHRLVDGELGELARQVLDSAQVDEPDAHRVARLRQRLGLSSAVGAASLLALGASAKAASSASLAAGSGVTATQTAAGASASLIGKTSLLALAKWTGVALVPLVVGATVLEVQRGHEPSPALPAAATSVAPGAKATQRAQQGLPPLITPEAPAPAAAAPPKRTATLPRNEPPKLQEREAEQADAAPSAATTSQPPQADRAIEAELAQLDAARRALNQGNAGLALIELDRHAAAFPRGALLAEATVLRISALKRAGNSAEAARLGQQFLARHPSHPLAKRVRALVGAGP